MIENEQLYFDQFAAKIFSKKQTAFRFDRKAVVIVSFRELMSQSLSGIFVIRIQRYNNPGNDIGQETDSCSKQSDYRRQTNYRRVYIKVFSQAPTYST
jgi:hypothetical protein